MIATSYAIFQFKSSLFLFDRIYTIYIPHKMNRVTSNISSKGSAPDNPGLY